MKIEISRAKLSTLRPLNINEPSYFYECGRTAPVSKFSAQRILSPVRDCQHRFELPCCEAFGKAMSELRQRPGKGSATSIAPSAVAATTRSEPDSQDSEPATSSSDMSRGQDGVLKSGQDTRPFAERYERWMPLFVFAIAAFVRFYRLDSPTGVVFGEVTSGFGVAFVFRRARCCLQRAPAAFGTLESSHLVPGMLAAASRALVQMRVISAASPTR